MHIVSSYTGVRAFFITEPKPPVPLHEIRLSALMAAASHPADFDREIMRACSDPQFTSPRIRENPILRICVNVHRLRNRMLDIDCGVDGYTMAHDVSAELLAVFDATGDVVAAIQRRTVFVMPPFRGLGLGAEIVIRAFECGVLHPDTMNDGNCLTVAGRANRRSAHRIAVERAVRAGLDVSPEVLADYQDSLPHWTPDPSRRSPSPRL